MTPLILIIGILWMPPEPITSTPWPTVFSECDE